MKQKITETTLEEFQNADEPIDKKILENAKLKEKNKNRLKAFKKKKHLQGITPSRLAWLRAKGKLNDF